MRIISGLQLDEMVLNRLSWANMDNFLEATSIEWHYFLHITINITVPTTPILLFLFCRFISVIVVIAVAIIVIIAAIVAADLLVILILYRCMIGRIDVQIIKCVVVDISILIKLALTLAIGLNTNNSATEKVSVSKLIYEPKSDVANGYACIGRIIIIFVVAKF